MGNPRARNIMRIRNLTRTGIILALGTERLYLEPTQKPAILQWTQNQIGTQYIEFGMPYQDLQIPIGENIAHVVGDSIGEAYAITYVFKPGRLDFIAQDRLQGKGPMLDSRGRVLIKLW